jgi:hypothetical protein
MADLLHSLTNNSANANPLVVCLRADCPMAAFMQLFPGGVPVFGSQPTLSIGGRDCFEINYQGVNTADVAIALFSEAMPLELCRVFLEWSIVAVPMEWVEVPP